jgi:hypothetical protein
MDKDSKSTQKNRLLVDIDYFKVVYQLKKLQNNKSQLINENVNKIL